MTRVREHVLGAVTSPRRVVIALLGALVAWNAAMLLTPFTLPAGTVTGLAGVENRVDFWPLWVDLPPVAGAVYAIGDLLCHQNHWRTVHVNGNQMPVDERMTAIFLVATAGLAAAVRARPTVFITDALRSALPRAWDARLPAARRRAARAVLALVVLALLPAAVDVLWENVLGRESTRILRFLTGSLAGLAGGLVLGAIAVAVDAFARIAWTRYVPSRFPALDRRVGALVTGPRHPAGWPRPRAPRPGRR